MPSFEIRAAATSKSIAPPNLCRIATILLLAAWMILPAWAGKPKDSEPPAKPDAAAEQGFDVPVPLGIPVKGIKIPHRNEEGKLLMTIEAEVATKLDEQHLEMQNMKIESFDNDGKTIRIEIPHSIFNLETRILAGEKSARITRDDFEITGDELEFNTKTRFATMRGQVRMVIDSVNIENK